MSEKKTIEELEAEVAFYSFWRQLFGALSVVSALLTLVFVAYFLYQSGIWK